MFSRITKRLPVSQVPADAKAYRVEGETYGTTIRRNSSYKLSQNVSRRNRRSR
jgi:hypothetical protein